MACNTCNKKTEDCGCKATSVSIDSICNPIDCGSQECSESFPAECILYTGDDIICDATTIVTSGDSVAQSLANIVQYFCDGNAPDVPADIVCDGFTIVSQGTTIVDALPSIVNYFCGLDHAVDSDILCGLDTVVSAGSDLTAALIDLVDYFCTAISNATTVNSNILCNLDTVVSAGTSVLDALPLIVTYFCDAIDALPTVTLANGGVGESLVKDGTGPTLETKGLVAGTDVSITDDGTDLTIAFTGTGVTQQNVFSNIYDSGWKAIPNFNGGLGFGVAPISLRPSLELRVVDRVVFIRGIYIVPLDDPDTPGTLLSPWNIYPLPFADKNVWTTAGGGVNVVPSAVDQQGLQTIEPIMPSALWPDRVVRINDRNIISNRPCMVQGTRNGLDTAGEVGDVSLQTLPTGTGYTTAINVPTTTAGGGLGLTLNITANGAGDVISVSVNNRGSGYAISDTVTITQGGGASDDKVVIIDTLNSDPKIEYQLTTIANAYIDVNGTLGISTQRDTDDGARNIVSGAASADTKRNSEAYHLVGRHNAGDPILSYEEIDYPASAIAGSIVYANMDTGETYPFSFDGKQSDELGGFQIVIQASYPLPSTVTLTDITDAIALM